MDPEDYSHYPVAQFEEDNILRELNKCLLAFRQNTTCPVIPSNANTMPRRNNSTTSSLTSGAGRENRMEHSNSIQRRCVIQIDLWEFSCYYLPFRLSPIGESGRSSPKDVTKIVIKQPSTSTKKSSYDSQRIENGNNFCQLHSRAWLNTLTVYRMANR